MCEHAPFFLGSKFCSQTEGLNGLDSSKTLFACRKSGSVNGTDSEARASGASEHHGKIPDGVPSSNHLADW